MPRDSYKSCYEYRNNRTLLINGKAQSGMTRKTSEISVVIFR